MVLGSLEARAGLSLDESLDRHRLLGDGASPRGVALTPLSLEPQVADGITSSAGGPGNDIPPLLRPEARGDGGVQLRAHTTLADGALQIRLGAAAWPGDDHPYSFDESSISVRLGKGPVYASVERRHWGPAWTTSLLLDGGARPVPAVGWRKTDVAPFETAWLAWLGPWSADVFAGQTSERDGPQHPFAVGVARIFWCVDLQAPNGEAVAAGVCHVKERGVFQRNAVQRKVVATVKNDEPGHLLMAAGARVFTKVPPCL